jgi:hypothetical protein
VYQDCRFEHVVWHNGGTEGHRAALYLLPDRGVAVMVMANRDGVDVDSPVRHLLAALHDSGALERRRAQPRLSLDWQRRVDAALALTPQLDAAAYEAAFADSFRSAIPLERMREAIAGFRAERGRCRVLEAVESSGPVWQAARLECERVKGHVAEAVLDADGRFIGLRLSAPEAHEARIDRQTAPACRPADEGEAGTKSDG